MLCRLFAGLIELVSQKLTAGPCQSFRRPTAPTDTVVKDVPAMAAFSKAALDGGIEHDSVYSLYQGALLSRISVICLCITLLFRASHLHQFIPGLGRDVHPLSVVSSGMIIRYPVLGHHHHYSIFHHYLGGLYTTVAASFRSLSAFLPRYTISCDGLVCGLTTDIVCSQTVGEYLTRSAHIISSTLFSAHFVSACSLVWGGLQSIHS